MTINVGVIGAGYWGKNHLRILNELYEAKLVAVAEKDRERGKYYSRLYHIDLETSYNNLIERADIDAVVIATPNSTHFEVASAAIKQGKHVLIEKPMCLSSDNVVRLIDLADKNSVLIMAGHTFSYNSAVLQMKKMIDKGELGDLYFILNSRLGMFPPRPDSGVIIDLAIHDIDIISLFMDRQLPLNVMATGQSYLRNLFEEIAFISLEFEDRILANITSSWLTPAKIRNCWISGVERTAFLDLLPQAIEIFEQKIDKITNVNNHTLYDLKTKEGMSYKPLVKAREALVVEDDHFIECIIEGKKPKSNGRIALGTILVAEAAIESLEKRKYVDMDKFKVDFQSYLM